MHTRIVISIIFFTIWVRSFGYAKSVWFLKVGINEWYYAGILIGGILNWVIGYTLRLWFSVLYVVISDLDIWRYVSDTQALPSKQAYKQGHKRSSTCSLPDEQYIHVVYRGMIHDSPMYEYYRRVWYWEMSAFYWMKMLRCAVMMSVTPLETCLLWYVWCWVDSDGTRPLCQSSFSHLLVNLDSHVLYYNG